MFISTSVTKHMAYYAINQLRLFANIDCYRSSCDNPIDALIHIPTRKMWSSVVFNTSQNCTNLRQIILWDITNSDLIYRFRYSEFYYIQIEKYARQAVSEGVKSPEDLHVGGDSEIYRVLNLHYNRNNHIEVSVESILFIRFLHRHSISIGQGIRTAFVKTSYDTIWVRNFPLISSPWLDCSRCSLFHILC